MMRFAALLVLLLTLPAHAFVLKGGSGSPPSGGTVVGTVSFYNNNATTVAGPIPVQSGIYFGPGVVPSGQSVVPSVGGVPLTQWECTSEALNWPDGSFRGCSFSGFLPNSITAGAREQVTWTLTSGSMPSIVAANPSEVTGASNFHQDFTNTSGASQSTNVPYGMTVGVVVGSGGTLTGTAIHQQPLLGASCGSGANCGGLTVSITGCSVAPTVSFTSTGGSPNLIASASVASAGSGCPVTGSGAWSFQVNSILAAAGSSVPLCTSQTTNTQVCQYSGSSVKDGFKVWGYYVDTGKPAWAATTVYASNSTVLSKGNAYTNASGCTSGSTAPTGVTASVSDGGCTWSTVIGWEQGVADVEYWKASGGSLYGFNVVTESDDGIYKTGQTIAPHSFSSDLYDGSLDLRGAANDTGYVGINQFGNGGGWYTVDPDGFPIWDIGNSTTNSPALNNVVVSLTTADKVYFHKNHAVPPLQQVTLTSNTVLPRNNSARSLGNMIFDFSTYVPLCYCDMDEAAGIGSGGSHAWDSVVTEANASWIELVDSASDGGYSWLGDSRLGALAAAGSWGGPSEPLTHHAVNWIPSIAWTAPANFTDPVRPNAYLASGFSGADMNMTQLSWPAPDTEHFGNWARFMYVVEGRRYMLDAIDLGFRQVQTEAYPPTNRLATFGGTTYYSEVNSYIPRVNSWYLFSTTIEAILANQEPDGQYAYKQFKDGYTEMAAYVSFVGSGTYGSPSSAFQKCTDWTSIGMLMLPAALEGADCSTNPGFQVGGSSWFMFGYVLYDYENDAMLNDGAITGVDATNAAFTGGMVQNADQCQYLTTPYTYPLMTNPYTQTLISTTDGTTVAGTSRPSQPGGRLSNMLAWTAGNSTFTASVTPTAGDENWFAKPTSAISGTTLAGLDMAVGVAGSQVYDMSVPADVGVDTFVNGGSPPSTSVTVNQAVTVPAPVTTTVNSITSPSVIVVAAPPGSETIEVGDTIVDTTHPLAISSSYTDFAANATVSSISGGGPFTVTLMYDGQLCAGECAPTSGDTVKFAHMLGFSSRYDYPDTGLLPASAGTPLPNGSFICLTDYTQGDEVSPGDRTVGTYPPTTSAGGTLARGQCFTVTEVGTSGTAWTLTTLSTATPPNTVVVPSSTGQGPGGYIPNAACPAAVNGQIQQGASDYQNPVGRIAEQYGFTNLAAALGINSGAANSAITLMAPYQTPLNTVYGPAAGVQYQLLDNHF